MKNKKNQRRLLLPRMQLEKGADRSRGFSPLAVPRERRLTAAELTARHRTLDALASGRLPPLLAVDKRDL